MSKTQTIGRVNNPSGLIKEVTVVGTAMISSGAVGYYVGSQMSGLIGSAVENLVNAFVPRLAVGSIHEMTVMLNSDGTVMLTYKTANASHYL